MVTGHALSTDAVWQILDEVKDPEVPALSVVELGIVRDVKVDGEGVIVVITPTYSGCPAMFIIEHDILAALRSHGVESAKIETVFTPAWTTEWMSDGAKAKLVAYGIAAPGHVARDDGLVTLTRRTTAVACPHCGSKNTVVKSEFGATACKSINYCNECLQPFEQFKAI